MSIADRRRKPSGFTFLEMVISISIVALMSLVVERVISTTQDAEKYLNSIRNATERGQRLAYELREVVSASRKLYGRDAVGLGFLAALQLNRDPKLPKARLPKFDEVNPMGPDTAGDPRTGSILLFVREADAAPAVAVAATKKIRSIDTYRFVCVYPHATSRMVITGQPGARDLVVWRSIPFPSYGQIMAISNVTERKNVVKDLYSRFAYDFAWDPNGSVNTSFYGLDALGNVAATPTAGLLIQEDLNVSERGRMVYANVQLAKTDARSRARQSIFTKDNPGTWVPDGFEVKIVGASGSRKVWIHVVVETQSGAGRVAVQDCTVIASTKDL